MKNIHPPVKLPLINSLFNLNATKAFPQLLYTKKIQLEQFPNFTNNQEEKIAHSSRVLFDGCQSSVNDAHVKNIIALY